MCGDGSTRSSSEGERTFITDGLGHERIGAACHFAPIAGVMLVGSVRCNVGVVLARAATTAPVLRADPAPPSSQCCECVDNAEAGNLT